LAEVLKCPHDRKNMRATIECLRSKDAHEIVNKEWDGIVFGICEFPFTPIIDGAFLDETPQKSLETKNFKKTNVMMGVNKDEGVFFHHVLPDRIVQKRGDSICQSGRFHPIRRRAQSLC
jgi:acetylcholinesterase